jgi:alkyl hydroperoxide reductase subunit AhpC
VPDTQRHLILLYEALNFDTHLAVEQSVLIDKAGIVRMIDKNPHPTRHAHEVLQRMRDMGLLNKNIVH